MAKLNLPRARLTLWMANLEKLKIGDFLVEKGIINLPEAMCPFLWLGIENKQPCTIYVLVLLVYLDENIRLVGIS